MRISQRFCWVEFKDTIGAQRALNLDGETSGELGVLACVPMKVVQLTEASTAPALPGGHTLRISQSKSAIHSNGLRRNSSGRPAPNVRSCPHLWPLFKSGSQHALAGDAVCERRLG